MVNSFCHRDRLAMVLGLSSVDRAQDRLRIAGRSSVAVSLGFWFLFCHGIGSAFGNSTFLIKSSINGDNLHVSAPLSTANRNLVGFPIIEIIVD